MCPGYEAIQAEHPKTFFGPRFSESREITVILLTVSTNFNVGVIQTFIVQIWFKHGMMIHTINCYMLILVYVTLILIQGHGMQKSKRVLGQLSPKVIDGS